MQYCRDWSVRSKVEYMWKDESISLFVSMWILPSRSSSISIRNHENGEVKKQMATRYMKCIYDAQTVFPLETRFCTELLNTPGNSLCLMHPLDALNHECEEWTWFYSTGFIKDGLSFMLFFHPSSLVCFSIKRFRRQRSWHSLIS